VVAEAGNALLPHDPTPDTLQHHLSGFHIV
jgi:hypothetical protein